MGGLIKVQAYHLKVNSVASYGLVIGFAICNRLKITDDAYVTVEYYYSALGAFGMEILLSFGADQSEKCR